MKMKIKIERAFAVSIRRNNILTELKQRALNIDAIQIYQMKKVLEQCTHRRNPNVPNVESTQAPNISESIYISRFACSQRLTK